MFASRIATGLVVALLLAACSGKTVPPPSPTPSEEITAPPAGPAPSPPPAVAPPAEGADTPSPQPVPAVLAEPATGALQRVAFQAGDVISAEGAYFLDAATGAGEGWVHADGRHVGVHFISDDNRFVAAYADQNGYLIDRHSDTVRGWDTERLRLLLADARGFLFAEVQVERPAGNAAEAGRYFWTGPDFKPRHVFTDAPPADHVSDAYLQRHGAGFRLELSASEGDRSRGLQQWHRAVRLFSWDGEPSRDLRIPGLRVFFSPDGQWVAWEEWPVGDLWSATVIADAANLQPHLRALGTTPCFQMTASGGSRWLSDSSGLVVDTAAGYRLLTLDGELQEVPAFAGLNWKGEPQPAPDHPDRFAVGRVAIVDRDGIQAAGVTLEGHVTPRSLAPWGETSGELRFALPPSPGHGACGERPPVPARVLLPARPLPAFPLVVRITDGCLSLRDRPRPYGDELACLPDGSRLAPVRMRADAPGMDWSDGSWLLAVKTEQGETGWVSLTGDHVTWAEPQEARGVTNPPPDGTELPPSQPIIGPEVPGGVVQLLEKNLHAYLDPYLADDHPEWDRLVEWRLESITRQDDIYFVAYAVRPAVRESNWWAGSGVPGKDGWILHKIMPAKVVEQDGGYQVVPGGTP